MSPNGSSGLFRSVCALNQKYRSLNQQDAPELFRYFVDGLINGELKIMKAKNQLSGLKTPFKQIESPTEKILGHYLANRVRCLHCDYLSWTFDLSIDLNVNIDNEEKLVNRYKQIRVSETATEEATKLAEAKFKEEKSRAMNEGGLFEMGAQDIYLKQDPVPDLSAGDKLFFRPIEYVSTTNEDFRLEDLLKTFFKTELLNSIENYYKCPHCNKGKEKSEVPRFITKNFFLYQPGPVLCIALKRFRQSGNSYSYGGGFQKIDTRVIFPLNLDINDFVIRKPG